MVESSPLFTLFPTRTFSLTTLLSEFNAFLGSQAFHNLFVKHEVADVVFGHLHHRHPSRIIDGIHYHMRPLGYIREWQLTEDFFQGPFLNTRFLKCNVFINATMQ